MKKIWLLNISTKEKKYIILHVEEKISSKLPSKSSDIVRSPQNLKKKAPFLFESNQKHQNKVGVFFKFLRPSKNIWTLDINVDVFNSYPSFGTSNRSKSKIRTEFLQTEYRITWNSSQEIAGHSSPLREAAWTLMHAWRPTDCWESSSRPMWKVATDIC